MTWLLAPVLAAGCVAGVPSGSLTPEAQPGVQSFTREVVLRVDPKAGTATLEGPRSLQAVVESQLNLVFDATDVSQAGGNTTFNLTVQNNGAAVSDLSLRLASTRTLNAPTNPIALGEVPAGGNKAVAVSYTNADGAAFSITINVSAVLKNSASQYSDGNTGGGTTPTPTPVATPTPAPSASTAPSPSTAPSTTPSATPTPVPSGVTEVPNPGPNAFRGRVLVNGKGASNITSVSTSYGKIEFSLKRVVNGSWVESIPLKSDANGYFTASNLVEGDYFVYYYNIMARDKIGFWQSKTVHVSPAAGATVPELDLYLMGQENIPLPGTTNKLPVNFTFNPPKQQPVSYRFRLHSAPGTSFRLVYQSNKFPGTQNTFTWDGTGAYEPLSFTAEYFWGVSWDWGPLGSGGNLYQKIRFSQ